MVEWRLGACYRAGMKKTTHPHPTRSELSVLCQLCNLIPPHLVPKLARQYGVDRRARSYSPWSHVVTLLYSQLAHSIGLNDLCDALRLHSGPLSAVRGASPPSRNNLSHANEVRDALLAESLYWEMDRHLRQLQPHFGARGPAQGWRGRFRRTIHLVDSSTIQLVANCIDWARHRRRKAAAKCHLRLDLQSFLPRFAVITTAAESDARRARQACAEIAEGEIAVFDKAYVDFAHLGELDRRGIWWVSRAKADLSYRVIERRPAAAQAGIVRDEIIKRHRCSTKDPARLRRIEAWVRLDGQERLLVFLTNQPDWSARSIAELYRYRWQIEVFFKQIKQSLQLSDFLGQSANAIRWQIWMALLLYLLLRFQAHLSQWGPSFLRLVTLLRAALWQKLQLDSLVRSYGTAKNKWRMIACAQQAYLPAFG